MEPSVVFRNPQRISGIDKWMNLFMTEKETSKEKKMYIARNIEAYQDLPGNTFSGRFFSKLRSRALAVMLKICLGVKFTPSLTWKLNPPDMAPGNDKTPKNEK